MKLSLYSRFYYIFIEYLLEAAAGEHMGAAVQVNQPTWSSGRSVFAAGSLRLGPYD